MVGGFRALGFRISGFGFRVSCLTEVGFRVHVLGFRVKGLGFRGYHVDVPLSAREMQRRALVIV